MDEILHPGQSAGSTDPDFPDAPSDWKIDLARDLAKSSGLDLSGDHLDAIRALQQFFLRHSHGSINLRELHDALEERFHSRGGLKYLYEIFPGGPVAQGCELAGLKVPSGAKDLSFGSVV